MKKISKEAIRGAIQTECIRKELTIREISKKYKVTVSTVMKWKNRENVLDKKRVRKLKMNRNIQNYVFNQAEGKFTGIEHASSRKIARRIKRKFGIQVSHVSVNSLLKKQFKKPRRANKTFYLTDLNKLQRKQFSKNIAQKGIRGDSIFFTDEKIFCLNVPLNPQTNQIRLSKKNIKKLNSGNTELFNKIHTPLKKFPESFMVSGGLTKNGVSKLIFCVGTMNNFSYNETLKFFKEDIERLNPNLYFQQDNAPCHKSNNSKKFIIENFQGFIEDWPANSPDLSPIEDLWSIVQSKLYEKKYLTLNEMKFALNDIWNRIPQALCERLCNSFDERINLISKTGNRINKTLLKQKRKTKSLNWNTLWNNSDDLERVVINDKIIMKIKNKQVKKLKKEFISHREKFYKSFNKKYSDSKIMKIRKKFGDGDADKLLLEKEEIHRKYCSENQPRAKRRKELNEMSVANFFASFDKETRLNFIRDRPFNINATDNVSTNPNTNINVSDINESDDLDLPQDALDLINEEKPLEGINSGMIEEEKEIVLDNE